MLEILLILFLSGLTYFQIREARGRRFIIRVIYAEYLRAVDMRKKGKLTIFTMPTIWTVSQRMASWRVLFSFRPLKYRNYMFPDEYAELRPFLDIAEAKQAAGEDLAPRDEDWPAPEGA